MNNGFKILISYVSILIYTCNCYTGSKKTELTICIPKLPCTFTGTGDLFAALLLAWMWHSKNQLKPSLEKIIATLQAVLRRTLHYAKGITTF